MSSVYVLAVICLSFVLHSLQGDAQPTVPRETVSCSSFALEEVAKEIRDDVKKLLTPIGDSTEPSKQALVSALVSKYKQLW